MTPEQEAACLRYNFDEGSKGDSGVKVMSVRIVTAAKPHKCFPCRGDIHTGERHRVERALMNGRMSNCRSCPTCCEAMAKCVMDEPGGWDLVEARYTIGRQRADRAQKGGA